MDFTNVNMPFSTKKERKLRTLILIHQNPFFLFTDARIILKFD